MRSAFPALIVVLHALSLFEVSEAQAQVIPSAYTYVEERQEAACSPVSVTPLEVGLVTAPQAVSFWELGMALSLPALSLSKASWEPCDVLLTTIDARLKLTATGNRSWHGLSPFMVFGGGIAFDLAGASAAEELLEPEDVFEFGKSFFGTLGLGTRWFVTDRVALRTDGVFSLWQLDTPPGFGGTLYGFEDVAENEWVRALSLTATLMFRW